MSTLNTPAFSGSIPQSETLSFELLPANVNIDTVHSAAPVTVTLPSMPRSFQIESLRFSHYDFDQSWGTSFELEFQFQDRVGSEIFTGSASLTSGAGEFLTNSILPSGVVLKMHFYFTNASSIYSEYAKGLALWIKGRWTY